MTLLKSMIWFQVDKYLYTEYEQKCERKLNREIKLKYKCTFYIALIKVFSFKIKKGKNNFPIAIKH